MLEGDGLDLFDRMAIDSELPTLISETDPDTQAIHIEKLLEHYIRVDGFAISVVSNASVIRLAGPKAIPENLIDQLDRLLFSERGDISTGKAPVIRFLNDNGDILSLGDEDDPSPNQQPANGVALRLGGNDFKGGLYVLTDNQTAGLLTSNPLKTQKLTALMSSLIANACVHFQNSEKMRFFKLYETVSSALGYVGDLQELLTTIIGIVTMELPSEEGSVLLFDEKTNELEFFSAIGDTGFGLTKLRFPADKGIAGQALKAREPIVVNNVQTCPYFFGGIDDDAGFKTSSILAAPLISGEECIGVIEAINKVGGDCFNQQDKRILMSIADEVALAVKNSRLFDYVVDSYCNIRRGEMSCKGCKRPLKSWTPCAKQLDKV